MNKTKKFILTLCLCALAFAFTFPTMSAAFASNASFESISLSNGDFNSSPSSSTLDTNPTGWSTIKTSSTAKSGIINVNESKFNGTYTSYFLNADENPGKANSDYDNKILMINSRNSTSGSEVPAVQGYKSSDVKLEAYSHYTFSILAKTINNAKASIYVSGLGDDVTGAEFESISTSEWTNYQIFVSTGTNSATVNVELWLGKKENITSSGAVFFDNISVERHTEQSYSSRLESAMTAGTASARWTEAKVDINYIDKINSSMNYDDSNLDFEKGTLANWETANNEFPTDATADVKNVSDIALGADGTAKNSYALELSSKTAGHFGYKSPKIELPIHAIYKISVNVKVSNDISGNAYIILKENNDVNEFYDKDNAYTEYTPIEKEIKISSNTSSIYTNDYTTCSFYIVGNALYPTSFNIELWLGQDDDLTKGTAVFDTIKVESISYSDYTSATENSSNVKTKLTSFEESTTFTNGTFNVINNQDNKLTYPLHAEGWTNSNADAVWGVINTNDTFYNAIKDSHLNGRANPGNPKVLGNSVPTTDTNNILLMWNKGPSKQSIESPTFSTNSDSYYTLTFSYKTISDEVDNDDILNVYILDNKNNVLYEELGINSKNVADNDWSKFEITIRTAHASKNLKVRLELGTENNNVSGIAYFDNFTINQSELTDDEYKNLVETSNIVDFTNGGFNLVSSTMENGVYKPLSYTGTLEEGTNPSAGDPVAFGGIINSEDNSFGLTPNPANESIIKNVMLIKTNGVAKYSIKANDSISLEKDKFYKFVVYVKTNLPEYSGKASDKAYGAEFSIDGVENASLSNITGQAFNAYTIYIKALSATDATIKFALKADSLDHTGYAFFDSFTYETINEEEYNLAQENKTDFMAFAETEKDADDDNNNDDSNSSSGANWWYIAPSLVFAVALVIALIAYVMKKVKFKRPEPKRKSTYDREKTLYRDAIKKEAEDRQREEVKRLETELASAKTEMEELEKENKERILAQRKEHGKDITKSDEKEFKLYANKHTKLMNRIDRINADIEYTKSTEFILRETKRIKQGK